MLPHSVSQHLSRVRNTNYWAEETEYVQGPGHVRRLLVARRRSRRRPLMQRCAASSQTSSTAGRRAVPQWQAGQYQKLHVEEYCNICSPGTEYIRGWIWSEQGSFRVAY
jgi:hypothetical protein